ncbi:MAG: hypothetical protein OK457_05045 [Thaumarchaeota archaeon]|nr:hypothetical protein [Nitrososphaerota archaeon]
MTTKTITVSVNAEVEQKFRRTAKAVHGKKKGYLGKALTEAMEKWTDEKRETDTVAATLSLLDHGIDLGGVKYKQRDELHER